MIISHFWLMALFALFVSVVFGALLRDEPREQIRTGAMMFGAFIVVAYVLGWLMYPLPILVTTHIADTIR